jgi:hypothetical protein
LRQRAATLGAGLAAALLAACAPTHHRIEPYRSDPVKARALEEPAAADCAKGPNGPRSIPKESFVSDGCSLWFDGGWGDPCCVVHDTKYWCGGSAKERSDADEQLRLCVAGRESSAFARLMWLGVRFGGHPIFPTWYRWGYGRDYLPWYGDYPAREQSTQEDSCDD